MFNKKIKPQRLTLIIVSFNHSNHIIKRYDTLHCIIYNTLFLPKCETKALSLITLELFGIKTDYNAYAINSLSSYHNSYYETKAMFFPKLISIINNLLFLQLNLSQRMCNVIYLQKV